MRFNQIIFGICVLMDKAGEGAGGGGGDKTPPATDHAKEISDLKAQNASILEQLAKLTAKPKEPGSDDPDLREKARLKAEADASTANNNKALEAALRFSMGAKDWLKNNQALLPKDVATIFETADRENYANAVEKDAAIKAAIVQSFFSVQSNLDTLTPGLKSALEEYLKLTKNGKQEKAQQIYDTIFEPSFDALRRVKKAEALNKGHSTPSEGEDAYKNKMIALSKKHYLGEKSNGT